MEWLFTGSTFNAIFEKLKEGDAEMHLIEGQPTVLMRSVPQLPCGLTGRKSAAMWADKFRMVLQRRPPSMSTAAPIPTPASVRPRPFRNHEPAGEGGCPVC
jgi:hypothetical protein